MALRQQLSSSPRLRSIEKQWIQDWFDGHPAPINEATNEEAAAALNFDLALRAEIRRVPLNRAPVDLVLEQHDANLIALAV